MSAASKKRTFRKFVFRGYELEDLLDLPNDKLVKLFPSRIRRRFVKRGLKRKHMTLVRKLRVAKKAVAGQVGVKPTAVKTHLRDMIILPEMIGSVVGVYNGKTFTNVEIKGEMIGRYLAEFSITYKPTRHGRAGVAAAAGKFVPLKG